jgi:hypothetical protein
MYMSNKHNEDEGAGVGSDTTENVDLQNQLGIEKATADERRTEKLILRDYSRCLFLYPLMVYSFIAFIIQWSLNPNDVPANVHGSIAIIWFIIFLGNIYTISFDFSVLKFTVLVILITLIIIIVIILYETKIIPVTPSTPPGTLHWYVIDLPFQFYFYIFLVLVSAILIALLTAQFHYVKIEQNEIEMKNLFSGGVKRYPTAGLTYEKKIDNVFKYIALRAGQITLHIQGQDSVRLDNVLLINRKALILDDLLSAIRMGRR